MSAKKITCSRFNKVGGQAVLEGVMMKAGTRTVTTCRREDGSLFVHDDTFVSVRKKHKWLNFPVLRGVVNFIEMMILSVKTMNVSAEALEIESPEPSRFEKFLKKRLGIAITDFVMIIGTSTCHLFHGTHPIPVEGICGYVQDAVIPGLVTFEAGQSCVGDGFAWLVNNLVPERYEKEAKEKGISIHKLLREKAGAQRPGESGLLALDWLNGNRSVLNNADLSGMILGLTLQTRPEEIYRALLEATAFGSRMILEQFEKGGLTVRDIRAAGGIARKDPLMMQIYADVLGKPIRVADTTQAGALGSAMYAAVAGGLYPDIKAAAAVLAAPSGTQYLPNAENAAVYTRLYREYATLHDYFGRGENNVMARLLDLARKA